MTDKRKGELMMVAAAVLWSISGITMKYIDWSPFLISGGRGIFSAIIVYLSMRLSHYPLRFTKKSMGIAVATFINILTFIAANKMTTAANAIVLQYTAPIFVVLITVFILKRRLKAYEIVAVLVAIVGVVFFFLDQMSPQGMLGNVSATVSGFFMALVYALSGEIKDDGERISGLAIGHAMLAIIGIPIGLILTDPANITTVPILLVVFLGTIQMGIPYVLFGRASVLISNVELSLITMLEPMLNPVWVALIYGEIPGPRALFGAALIIGAVIAYTVIDARRNPA
ncbi:MAG: EamA family transporter [Firmicutes bacterium]|nr:EamA family transporter [Bacillota bacterium]